MAELHIISGLRLKRAEVSGYIAYLERKINHQRADLVHIDATIRLFSPGTNPDAIPPKRVYRRTKYFARGELSKRCLDALRKANGQPLTALAIAKALLTDKALPIDDGTLTDMTLTVLRRLAKCGTVMKSGTSRNAQWVLPSLLL